MGDTNTATMAIRVADTTPPEITLALSPESLWPPNHRMAPIRARSRAI
jgi:hypothetical protein